MTSPIAAGNPDWQENVSPSNIVVADLSGTFNNGQIVGPFYVGSMPFVTLDALCPGAGTSITIGWFNDAAASILIGRDVMHIETNIPGRVTFPVIGPFCTIQIALTAGSAVIQGSLTMSASPSNHATGTDGILFSATGVALGAGLVATLNAPRVRQGEGSFSVATGVAAGFAELWVVDFSGVATFLCEISLAAARRPYKFYCPPMRLRAIIRNTGGATLYNVGVSLDSAPR